MANQTINARITLRSDSASNWSVTNPTLLKGEFGYETDTRKFKLGDGFTTYNSLEYASASAAVTASRDPASTDNSYDIGTMWINTQAQTTWVLIKLTSGNATWLQLVDTDQLANLGAGDMLTSVFTPNALAASKTGYVDKSLQSDKLTTSRLFSVTGDATATAIQFDGTGNVSLEVVLATILATPGTYTKLTVDSKGRVTAATTLSAADIPSGISTSKITGLGTAATLNTGTSIGNVVLVGADGKIAESLIPSLAITDVFVVDSQAAMLALSAANIGDVCVRTDSNRSYILSTKNYGTLADWVELKTPPNAVLSVNGKTGAITLTTDDITEGSNNLYYTNARFDERFATKIGATASTALADGATIVKTSDTLIVNCGDASGYTGS